MSDQVVIVGGSHAGVSVADHLRKGGFDGTITMVCAENELPYQRPPLSKAYMSGDMTLDRLQLRPAEWYDDNKIDLRLGITAISIDRASQHLHISDGEPLPYGALVLATGATPRTLPENVGGSLKNVHVMRSLSDAHALMDKMKSGADIVVIGGGYIGLEAAAEAAKKDLHVTVIEAADRILRRVACAETSDVFRALHERYGVTILENTQIAEITADEHGACHSVKLANGEQIRANIVIVGIGIAPNVELAIGADLLVDGGIVVDDHARTTDPNIYACGDCSLLPFKGERTRLESVQNANDQGAAVADNIAGKDRAYRPEPWFWSDQFDMKLQIAGLNRGYDAVVTRPGKREGSRSHFYFAKGKFLAVDCMNDAAVYAMSRRILASDATLTPEQAADQGFNLKSLLSV